MVYYNIKHQIEQKKKNKNMISKSALDLQWYAFLFETMKGR